MRSAALSSCGRARRSRPAGGHFHLRAQMKVTKAKGLNTIWLVEVATGYDQDVFDARRYGRVRSEHQDNQCIGDQWHCKLESTLNAVSCRSVRSNRISPFALVPFIWGRK